jgi:MFS family permease
VNAEPAAPQQTAWSKVALLWLCGVGAGLQFAKASVAFDVLASDYQASPTLAGWLLSAVGVAGVVFGAAAGLLAGRIGLRTSLIGGLVVAALISLFQMSLPPVALFLASRVLEGGAHLAIIVAAPSCLSIYVEARRRTIVLSLWGTFFSTAFLVAGLAGPPILDSFGLRTLFAAHAVCMVGLAALAFVFIRPALPARRPGREAPLSAIFRQQGEIYANPRTALPAICFLCYTAMYLALQTMTADLAPVGERRWLFAGMPLVSVVTTLFAGSLAQSWGSPFRVALGAFAATAVATILLQGAVDIQFAVVPAALLRMAFLSLLPGAIYPMIPLLCDGPATQARAYGAIAQLGNVGSALGPPLFGASVGAIGPLGLMAPALALSACGFALTRLTARKFEPSRPAAANRLRD